MRSHYSPLQRGLLWLAAFILVAGLGGAVLAYRSAVAEEQRIEAMATDGTATSGPDESSKGYVLEVQRYGGNAAVIGVRFNHWVASLWHGKRLAYTLAVLAVLAAFGCFRAANELDDE